MLLTALALVAGCGSSVQTAPAASADPSVDPSEACTANTDCSAYYTCACHACLTKSIHVQVCENACPTNPCAGKTAFCSNGKCALR